MGSHKILDLVDSAVVAYILSAINASYGTAADVLPGKAVGGKELPVTLCDASSWGVPEGMEYTGNSLVKATVSVVSAAYNSDSSVDTVAASKARTDATFDLFYEADTQSLAAAITAAAQAAGVTLTAMSCTVIGGSRNQTDDAFIDSIELEILACPSALT